MKLTFIQLSPFIADCKRLGLDDDALLELELLIMDRPEAGKVIPGTGGLRKIRFSPHSWHRGKSGAARVCYAYFTRAQSVYLIAAYGKNEQEDINPCDKAGYRRLIQEIDKLL